MALARRARTSSWSAYDSQPSARSPNPRWHRWQRTTGAATAKGQRPVYFAESEGFVDCPVYDRYALGAGAVVQGPAIVEEIDSTTVVHPQYQVRVDEVGQMVLTTAESR